MGADRIKGITIEIDGDTTKLSKELKSVNTELRQSQNQLKDIDKLLKLDPGNTALLQQKFKALGDSIDQTKTKLQTLQTAQEQMAREGKVGTEEYDALQREIIETEQNLKSLTQEYRNFGSVAAQKVAVAGEKMKELGGKIESAGRAITPVSTAVAGLGVAAVKTTADFESSMSKVAAVSGAAGKEFEDLRDKAIEMGSKTKFSASEAADAMNYMAMAGWKTEDMLQGIEGIMNLAAASGEDLATTSDIVTDALTAFGMTAADSGHFADILAAASSNANTNVSMMGETFKYAAPIAGALGYSAEDTALAIGLMANAGIKGSQAGTSLRKIMTELNGDIEIAETSIGDITIATTNADGSMREFGDIIADCREVFAQLTESEQSWMAELLVGKEAMSGFLAIMNASEADVTKLSTAISGCSGSAQSMADTMNDNLAGQLTLLKSALESLAISIGTALMPTIREIVSHIQEFVDWLNGLDEETQQTIIKIGLFVAALGPCLIIIGKLTTALGSIMTIVPNIVGAFGSIGGAIGKITGSAGGAASSLGKIGSAASSAAAPASSAGKAIGTLSQNALGFISLGAGILLAAAGLALMAEAAIDLGEAGAPAAIAMGAMVAVIALLAVGAAALGPALTAGAVGLVAFGAAVALVGIGILAASAGLTLLAGQLPTIAEYGGQAAIAIAQLGAALGVFAVGALAAGTGAVALGAGLVVAATGAGVVTVAALALAVGLGTLTVAVVAITVAIIAMAAGVDLLSASIVGLGVAINTATGLVIDSFNQAKSTATSTLNGVRSAFTSTFNGIKSYMSGILSWLQGIFNFKWELPKIKLPHFSISGSFSLNPPSTPKFDISWYKKAMQDGMILNSPTIFGMSGGRLLGGGEAGPEAIVGVDSLRSMITDAVVAAGGYGGDIIIPVYIGQDRIDELVVNSTLRTNYRSGGR